MALTKNEELILRRLRCDLDDCRNPKILKKYPHLGSQTLIDRLEKEIATLENLSRHLATLEVKE